MRKEKKKKKILQPHKPRRKILITMTASLKGKGGREVHSPEPIANREREREREECALTHLPPLQLSNATKRPGNLG